MLPRGLAVAALARVGRVVMILEFGFALFLQRWVARRYTVTIKVTALYVRLMQVSVMAVAQEQQARAASLVVAVQSQHHTVASLDFILAMGHPALALTAQHSCKGRVVTAAVVAPLHLAAVVVEHFRAAAQPASQVYAMGHQSRMERAVNHQRLPAQSQHLKVVAVSILVTLSGVIRLVVASMHSVGRQLTGVDATQGIHLIRHLTADVAITVIQFAPPVTILQAEIITAVAAMLIRHLGMSAHKKI